MTTYSERTIPAGEFKALCLQLMDQVNFSGQSLTITKHGKPVAKLTPPSHQSKTSFGCLKGSATYVGNLMDPIDEVWDADK